MSEPLLRTPLYDFHVAHGARMVPFAGWEMPVQYRSILEEHRACRTAAGLFDVSHMGEVEFTGPQAVAALDHLATGEVSRLAEGRALYTIMCDETGGTIDDLIVYRLGPERFLAVVNASNTDKDVAWMRARGERFDCEVRNVSFEWGQLAIQGPQAEALLQPLTPLPLAGLKRLAVAATAVAAVPCLVARTGYTGEDGFELYVPAEQTEAVARAIHEAGQPRGLQLVGLGARDSLRLEAGYPLYGHELGPELSPLAAGLGWAVKLGKEAAFIGQQALRAEAAAGPARRVAFFRLEGPRIARQGMPVLDEAGAAVGAVASGSMSPILNRPIGSALVAAAALDGRPLFADLRGTRVRLEVARPPLHKLP